jgi:hypothetical protein
MSIQLKIAGRKIELKWDNAGQRRFDWRSREIGGINFGDLAKPAKSLLATVKILWAALPPEEFKHHESPEDLYAAILDDEAEAIAPAVVELLGEMFPDLEKKSTTKKSPSPESNSD